MVVWTCIQSADAEVGLLARAPRRARPYAQSLVGSTDAFDHRPPEKLETILWAFQEMARQNGPGYDLVHQRDVRWPEDLDRGRSNYHYENRGHDQDADQQATA